MSTHNFYRDIYSLEQRPVLLWATATIGASGAPTLVTAKSKGITSITRNGTGDYTVVFESAYNDIRGIAPSFTLTTAAGVIAVRIHTNSVATSSKSVRFITLDAAEAAADPANGVQMDLEFQLRDSKA